ncbi:MAG TPA: prolyl oligopeptidase family serine peptidase, partial [Tichowtungia sp.]|nr:prolyl oligopeptidase family serine peptidase [Tichowtungia sp.]
RSTTSSNYTGSALATNLISSDYVDTMATNGTTYYYVVTAVDAGSNESAQSSEVSATPLARVAFYTFDGSSVASVDTDADSTASDLSDIDGIGTGTNGLSAAFNSGSGQPAPSVEWTIGDINDGTVLDDDYLTFTVTPGSGIQFEFVELSFDYNFAGNAGSTIYLLSSQGGFASTDDAIEVFNEAAKGIWNTYTASLAAMDSEAQATEFRLYFDTDGTFDPTSIKLDNLQLAANAGTAPPDAPTGLAATSGDAQVSLDWDDNAGSNLTYRVYRSTNPGSYGSALTNGLTASEYVDSTAGNFTTYYYVVTAVDTNNVESDAGSEVSATPADPSNQAPAFSTNLIVKTDAEAGLAYSETIEDDASDPESDPMTFSLVSTSSWLSVAFNGDLSGTPAAEDVGTNTFTVQVSAAGGSDTATLQIIVDPDTTAPAAPTGLTAVDGNGSARLSWTPNGETDLAGYNVYRSTTSSNYSSTALVTNLQSSSTIDSSAENGTTYYYVVTAVDASGNESAQSAEDSATPDESILEPLVWLDASQGVGLDSGKVAVWTNLASPGTFDAVQLEPAQRPVVLLEEWPGHSLVYFDGTDDLLTLDGSVSNALFEGEMTVFFVGRRRAGGGFKPGGILGNFQTGFGDKGWALNVLDTGEYQFRLPGTSVNGGAATLGQDYVVMSTRYEDIGGDTGRMEIFGTLNEDPAGANNSPFAINSSSVDVGIGMFCGFKSLICNQAVELDVAEIRIYDSALSDTNRQAIYDELTAKYSLAAKEWYNIVDFQPEGYSVPADSTIEITFDVPMDADSITNIIVGAGGLDGLAEQTDWQVVSGQWAASVSNTVFTFTPDASFDAGELVMCEIPASVASAAGGVNESVTDRELFSFVVDTGKTYSYQRTVLDPMAVVSNEYVDEFGVTNVVDHNLPMTLHIPDTPEPCPVMFWVHGGTFNGGNTGTLTDSATEDAQKAEYFAEKLGIAAIGVAWRSTLSEGTFTKATNDIDTAIQYVIDNAATLGIDTSRMGIYGGSAGTPTSSLVSQTDTNMICYIGFNGSYDFVDDGYGAGSTGFGQDDPSWEANSAIYNIRANPPATLLLHGSDDGIIPNAESLDYEAALQAAGGDAETLIYRGYGHAFYKGSMNYPTMVACSQFLSRIFGLNIYVAGYEQWLSDNGIANTEENFYEYAMNSDPTDGLAPTNRPVFSKQGSRFIYVHPKRSDDTSLIYTVETTTNLLDSGSWTNEGYIVTGTNVTEGTLDFVTN